MKEISTHKIVLAALLHDIGKFWQRADNNGVNKSTILDSSIKDLQGQYCPTNRDGFHTHKHVIWTAQFFAKFEKLLKGVFDDNIDKEDTIIRLAAMHHYPHSDKQKLIQLADWLSSGVDRSMDPDSQKEVEDEKSWHSYKKTKLKSIFESLGYRIPIEHKYLLPLMEQDLSSDMMPQQTVSEGNYTDLWNKFTREVEFIQSENPLVIIETITELLHKYTSTIPSSTIHLPDVSLFDHLKSTAAIVHCVYEYKKSKNEGIKEIKNNPNIKPFLMMGGDLSGIQKYIYDIISKNAAKNLKGRSFYLQLLVESFLEKIKKKLGLYNLNVIYSSGGGFYILAPNTEQIRTKIKDLEIEFQHSLFSEFETQLYLALDFVSLSCEDFFEHNISEKWRTLGEKLNEKKRQRFKERISSNYGDLFEPIPTGGDKVLDTITGQVLSGKGVKIGEDYINASTYEQIELGKELRSVDYWITTDEEITYWPHNAYNPGHLGIYHYFVSKDSIRRYKDRLKGSFDQRTAKTINDTNFLESGIQGIDNIYGFEYYGGNDFPADSDGKPITFDELAKADQGLNRLGVLRMDVDNLGQIFINGMREEKRTFSRYSTLSRNLDWFFKGYLNTIWSGNETYKNNIQIIYSGGDDLFVVGQWIPLVKFARKIKEEFDNWVCHNRHLTLSGGIALIGGSFPILKGAIEAEDAEKLAKNYERDDQAKNAFSIFDYSLSWNPELDTVIKWKNDIKEYLKSEILPKSFISKISEHYGSVRSFHPEITPKNVYWMSAYDLQKLKTRVKNTDAEPFIDACIEAIYTNQFQGFNCTVQSNYHFLELLYLATRWAEFELRNLNN